MLESHESPPASAQSAARTGCPCQSATASSSVAKARGCFGSFASCAFKIVLPGPVIAITRVVAKPGAMPIHIDSIGRLLVVRLDRHNDGGTFRDGKDGLRDTR